MSSSGTEEPIDKRDANSAPTPGKFTAFPISSYIPEFDGLRALSILAVFFAHSEFLRALPHAGNLEYGRLGVDLFFVLSGFLITGILLDSKNSEHYLRNFYARRTLRIWPLYYFVLSAVLMATLAFPSMTGGPATSWRYFYLYMQNLPQRSAIPFGLEPTWSLAIEEQFYLTWPLTVLLVRRRLLMPLLCCLVILSVSLRLILYCRHAPLQFIHSFTFCRLDSIVAGCAAAIWLRSPSCNIRRWRRCSWWFLGLGLSGAVLSRLIIGQQSSVVGYTFFAAAFAGLLGLSLLSNSERGTLSRVLRVSFLRYIGRISYGLYLLHMPLFLLVAQFARSHRLMKSAIADNLAMGGLQFGLALAAASLSWRFFEGPILRLKSRFPSASRMHWPNPSAS